MGTIIAGTDARITIVVRPEAPGSLTTSIVVLDPSGNDTNLLNNSASLTVTIDAAPGPGLRGGDRCFIATAAYGSHLDPHVVTLRRFRDEYLLTHQRAPPSSVVLRNLAAARRRRHSDNENLRTLARWTLTPAVYAAAYPLPAVLLALGIALMTLRRRSGTPTQ